jgi:phosphoribosylanthranilate isomerase
MSRIPVKICGLTRPDQANAIAALGVDAIGLVFFPPSPRHVTEALAKAILNVLPPRFPVVSVTVNEPAETTRARARRLGLRWVQLHGDETPETVAALRREGLFVIKAIRVSPDLLVAESERWPADLPLLVESPAGHQPGGTGTAWEWAEAAPLAARRPIILAGGLDPDNAARVVHQVQPAALDLSSGVEEAPGIKSLEKVRRLLDNLSLVSGTRPFPSPWAATGP